MKCNNKLILNVIEYDSSFNMIGSYRILNKCEEKWYNIMQEYDIKNNNVKYIRIQFLIKNDDYVNNYGYILIDKFVVWEIDDYYKINEMFFISTNNNDYLNGSIKNSGEILFVEKISATKYKIEINIESNSILCFSEGYDPLWAVEMDDGRNINSIPIYGVINGFLIDKGKYEEIRIKYIPQEWFNLSMIFSIIFTIICIMYIIYNDNIFMRIKKTILSISYKLNGVKKNEVK